jgi:DNA-binding NtrC family response regulator
MRSRVPRATIPENNSFNIAQIDLLVQIDPLPVARPNLRGTYVHLRLGMVIAEDEKAALIAEWLAEIKQLRLEPFAYIQDAMDFVEGHRPHVIIAEYERFGAAGIHGLGQLMGISGCPVILICGDISEWEREQFEVLGVRAWFEHPFDLARLGQAVDGALKIARRIGSSERLPVVTG